MAVTKKLAGALSDLDAALVEAEALADVLTAEGVDTGPMAHLFACHVRRMRLQVDAVSASCYGGMGVVTPMVANAAP